MSDNFSQITEGGLFSDERGTVAFANDFDLSPIKRFYRISHPNTDIIRAWQGHKIECKWFYCVKGSFEIKVIKIDNWTEPSKDLPIKSHVLRDDNTQILAIKEGCCTAIRALENEATLMVFSDKTIDEAKDDDFRFDKNYWFNWEITS